MSRSARTACGRCFGNTLSTYFMMRGDSWEVSGPVNYPAGGSGLRASA